MKRLRCLVAISISWTMLLLQGVRSDAPILDSANLPLEHRAVYGPPLPGPPAPQYGAPVPSGPGPDDPWPLATPDMPQIKHLQVQCEKTHMRVNIEFDRPFYGMIFSKGFYSDPHCVHLKPGSGHLSATFEIFLNSCGMSSSANHNTGGGYSTPSGSYVENTIIIQYDPYVQEVWDQARKLRCTWYDFYEKAVTFRPFQVDMLHAVTANFLGDNLQCWMQIQVGKGPWASEVSGIVKIGQTMTMVLAIKDDENKFDMLVRNCVAHDGKRAPIQLVDQHGCVVRPKIMSKFQKIKNFGPSASVVSFAYFQAFKFPDSMNVHFQCVIQVCRYNCPEPRCGADYGLPQLPGEYGPPPPSHTNSIHSEYGPPPLPEYGAPAAYPDPRHPSGPAGAYSENKPDVLPPPSSTSNPPSPSSPAPHQTSPSNRDSNTNSNSNSNNNNNNNNNNNEIHLPPPPLPGHAAQYTTVKRKGGVSDELEGNLATLGGRPRSVEGLPAELQGARRRRHLEGEILHTVVVSHVYKREAQEMTDVNTSRIIQVVAPGDVNFALNTNNETVVISTTTGSADSESICMSLPGFVAGLIMLLVVLVVACLVAAFLFVRVRQIDRKGVTTTFVHPGYDNSEFVKMAS
ncbi:transmembrane protein dusky-like [Lycorma delicatula]|uniref:transmembrane protein dusky-like n=1 Tax=Lycorma delicatula TaxID=130591 RepID=UPI003F51A5B3